MDWRGILDWKWNSEKPFVFDKVVLDKTLGTQKAREIWARFDRRLDLWESGTHTGLVGDALEEGRSREGCVSIIHEEEEY